MKPKFLDSISSHDALEVAIWAAKQRDCYLGTATLFFGQLHDEQVIVAYLGDKTVSKKQLEEWVHDES